MTTLINIVYHSAQCINSIDSWYVKLPDLLRTVLTL